MAAGRVSTRWGMAQAVSRQQQQQSNSVSRQARQGTRKARQEKRIGDGEAMSFLSCFLGVLGVFLGVLGAKCFWFCYRAFTSASARRIDRNAGPATKISSAGKKNPTIT